VTCTQVKGLIPAVNTVGHDASWQHYFRFCNIKYAVLGMQYQDNNDRKEIRSRHFSQVFPMNPDMDGLVTVCEQRNFTTPQLCVNLWTKNVKQTHECFYVRA
jgi:hypothetical protein